MSEAPLIELRNIRKTYGGEAGVPVEVLRGISLSIHAGEFVAIMGASGSGKSTLMNIIGCLDRPSAGDYRFAGRDVAALDRDTLAQLRREAFGFVFQSYNLIGTASALENVEVPAIYAGVPAAQRHRRAQALLQRLGLGERLRHRPSQLSGGQQQRVSIARALMNGGSIILADEPTGALDSRSGEEVMQLLQELAAEGHTVILITHDREVARHARRLIELRDGLVVNDSGGDVPAITAARAALPERGHTASPLADAMEAAKMALRALHANVFRTVLTLLGIVIGVASVIAMLAIGEGARQQVLDQIGSMGSNLLLVRSGGRGQRSLDGGSPLTAADADILAELPNVLAAVPELQGNVTVRFGNLDARSQVTATSADFPLLRNWSAVRGSFFEEDDSRRYAAVAVLGQTVVDNLFPDRADPVGEFVLINNIPFLVIGVMGVQGATPWGQDSDDVVFVPLTTGSLRLFGQHNVRSVTVAVHDVAAMDATQQAVTELLRARHPGQEFQIRNMAAIIETATAAQNTLTILLGSIAAISLLVGGIGVMNIMLVTVTERTREIGVRLATGARTRDILQQFLTEALLVSALGGVVGVLLGLAAGQLINILAMPVQFSLPTIGLAFTCAAATGLVFGFTPALKAARLDPVAALASE